LEVIEESLALRTEGWRLAEGSNLAGKRLSKGLVDSIARHSS